jgi:hypothetical protein
MLRPVAVPSAVVPGRSRLPRRVLELGAVALLAAGCSSDGSSRADQGRSIASEAGLAPDVADFFATATATDHGDYRLSYASTDSDNQPLQITITSRGADNRIDLFHADGTIDSTIRLGGTTYQCTKTSEWQCGAVETGSATAGGVFDPDTVRHALDQLRLRAEDYDFSVESRTIAGAGAQCLVTTRKPGHDDPALGAAATLCLSAEGAQLLVAVPSGTIEASDYTTTLPPDAFDLPADPATTSTTPGTEPTSSGPAG